jgi:tripartite-type tricarboxylate transporter receptor subunit TctC
MKRQRMLKGALTPWSAGLILAGLVASADAQSVENFYRGRTVTIVVGFGVGGGYDIHGRVLARHLGKHIPGNPTVIAQNMVGAGSLRAANFLYSAAPKDGTTSVCSRAAWRWSR